MPCGCGKNLAHQQPIMEDFVGNPHVDTGDPYLFGNNRDPFGPDSDLYPMSLQGQLPASPGRDEQGNLVPFVMGKSGCSPVNPAGCQFSGKQLNNYGPYDYPDWIL